MAYVALYRKFRPQSFEHLVGQENIVRTLINQLETGRIAHAYLFAGPRGTGKTSTAKLFARAINCASPVNGNPCGECDVCRAYSNDDNMDIIEIDAASNNGVDNIRDIRDKVIFTPAYGRYKVYIIDEVHMLSPGAFNALLKTLEEPPKHVVFILATTEIHKLPATILSRCQRFDFKLIPSEIIHDRLKYVLNEVGAAFEDEAIDLIAKNASGGMRDALSLADVCISYCGNNVSLNDAMNVLGISDRGFVFDMTDALLSSDSKRALELCRVAEDEGKDIGVLAIELMEHLRDIMLSAISTDAAELKGLTKEIQAKLGAQARNADIQRILRGIEILSKLESEIKIHTRPEIQLETAVVRICTPMLENDISALADRVSVLEKKSAGVVTFPVKDTKEMPQSVEDEKSDLPPWNAVGEASGKTSRIPVINGAEEPFPTKKKEATAEKNASNGINAQQSSGGDAWTRFCDRLKQDDMPLYMMLRKFSGAIDGGHFTVYIPENAKNKVELVEKNADKLSATATEALGRELKVRAVLGTPVAGAGNGDNGKNSDMMKAALDLFS